MEDQIRHGVEARKDWSAYHSTLEGADPRYHNHPRCPEGAQIREADIRPGTAMRPLCDWCRQAQQPVK
jgi:hypothetical protein